ncbi:peptidase M48-like protein [Kribbella sp. VKM Ac-2527]|uniref:Peptidase M48-like protein n=1 Tax=Kribbella caucasensis TaxID=2512215 RepID=A0A4V3CAT3_9ACTN|nr:M48 family metalloprotease [Kribbella sp. VKM Ac-2527]TDO51412.1 peptidase M48-like protein [Kribbella sp. VKM Ac-2527]
MLSALGYHRGVLGYVHRVDEHAWAALQGGPVGGVGDVLLRNAYRLAEAAHPCVHQAGRRAAEALGVDAAVEFFQVHGGGDANAVYVHQDGPAVIVFEGPLLERLDSDELTAVVGHELAHRLLWEAEDGAYLVVDRLLDAAAGDARTPQQYLETYRRWRLATELYADRGALTACGELSTTVRALLKLQTGLSSADPEAYLRQADELDLSTGSRGTSHPEGVARAWALKNWLAGEDVESLVTGPLDVDAPDLLDAALLRELSTDFAARIAQTDGLRTDAVATTSAGFADPPGPLGVPGGAVRRFDEPLAVRPIDGAPMPRPRPLTEATKRYLCYLLLDLATADPDTGDAGLVASMAIARRVGLTTYDDLADDELGWSDKRRAKLAQSADEVVA